MKRGPQPFRARFGFPFTQRDTPESRRRIESDLRTIVSRVVDHDPHLEALVLTGGFSRGEGSVRGKEPLNDYDLIAIRRIPGGDVSYRRLAHELEVHVGLEVDLMPVWRARLPHVARKLFWLDVRVGARVIAGDPLALDRLPTFGPEDLPAAEVARLLGNRAAGLVLALPAPGEAAEAREMDLQATKAVLAAMDARLLARKQYAPRMRERLEMARALPDSDLFRMAVRWKLEESGTALGSDWWRKAKQALLRAVEDTGARDARDGLVEHGYHVLHARRWRTSPSQTVRLSTWDLLAEADPERGIPDVSCAKRALARLGPLHAPDWPSAKRRFARWRAQTLQ